MGSGWCWPEPHAWRVPGEFWTDGVGRTVYSEPQDPNSWKVEKMVYGDEWACCCEKDEEIKKLTIQVGAQSAELVAFRRSSPQEEIVRLERQVHNLKVSVKTSQESAEHWCGEFNRMCQGVFNMKGEADLSDEKDEKIRRLKVQVNDLKASARMADAELDYWKVQANNEPDGVAEQDEKIATLKRQLVVASNRGDDWRLNHERAAKRVSAQADELRLLRSKGVVHVETIWSREVPEDLLTVLKAWRAGRTEAFGTHADMWWDTEGRRVWNQLDRLEKKYLPSKPKTCDSCGQEVSDD